MWLTQENIKLPLNIAWGTITKSRSTTPPEGVHTNHYYYNYISTSHFSTSYGTSKNI
jgi:hypothetical protein